VALIILSWPIRDRASVSLELIQKMFKEKLTGNEKYLVNVLVNNSVNNFVRNYLFVMMEPSFNQ